MNPNNPYEPVNETPGQEPSDRQENREDAREDACEDAREDACEDARSTENQTEQAAPPRGGNSGSSDMNSPSDAGYTYVASHSDSGCEYTNPDGSHGCIYNADAGQKDPGRRYRGAIIALSAVLTAFVLGACCLVGAYFVTNSLREDDEISSDTRGDVETSGGLFIEDNDDDSGSKDETKPNNSDRDEDTAASDGSVSDGDVNEGEGTVFQPDSLDTEQSENSPGSSTSSADPAPVIDSIQKLPSERKDTDGDGRAEIETDERGEVLTSAGKDALSTATVVHRVAASVVEITTETIVQSGYIGQYVASGAGSGVVISAEGYIVTNNHVIDGAKTITVRMNDGTEFPATLIGTDEQTDVAVLKIDAGQYALTVATLGSSFDLVVGEDVLAIGNPLGALGGTVTEGVISATAREISVSGVNMTLLQVSAPINPGNSGGGLFNMAGELVGVVNAKVADEDIEGLGFAIPVDIAYKVILELIEFGYVRGRPALDFTVVAYSYLFQNYVCVYDDDHEIVQYGDIILAADGVSIQSVSQLESIVRSKKVGDTLELIIQRNSQQITVTVTLVEKKPG